MNDNYDYSTVLQRAIKLLYAAQDTFENSSSSNGHLAAYYLIRSSKDLLDEVVDQLITIDGVFDDGPKVDITKTNYGLPEHDESKMNYSL